MKNIYAKTPRMIKKALPNKIPISVKKSPPSLPSKSPKENPLTSIFSKLLLIKLSSSLS